MLKKIIYFLIKRLNTIEDVTYIIQQCEKRIQVLNARGWFKNLIPFSLSKWNEFSFGKTPTGDWILKPRKQKEPGEVSHRVSFKES